MALAEDGASLVLTLRGKGDGATGAAALIKHLFVAGIDFRSIDTSRSSLEEIFVGLVEKQA